MLSKQDRVNARTPTDLERKYNLGSFLGDGDNSIKHQAEKIAQLNLTLSQVDESVKELDTQVISTNQRISSAEKEISSHTGNEDVHVTAEDKAAVFVRKGNINADNTDFDTVLEVGMYEVYGTTMLSSDRHQPHAAYQWGLLIVFNSNRHGFVQLYCAHDNVNSVHIRAGYGSDDPAWKEWNYLNDADTVNGHTVETDVPADAVFTDTTYNMSIAAATGEAGLCFIEKGNTLTQTNIGIKGTTGNSVYVSDNTIYIMGYNAASSFTDLNYLTENGLSYQSGLTNVPAGVETTGHIYNLNITGKHILQFYFPNGTCDIYKRLYSIDHWTDWIPTDSLSVLGVTATAAELNYCVGVTGNIQTQLNAKAASSHTHKYAGSSSAGGVAHTSNTLNYTMLHEGRIADTTVTKDYDYSYFTDYSYVGITAEIGDKLEYRLFPINAFCDYYNNPIGCKFTDGDKEGYVSYDVDDKYIWISGDVVVYEIVLFPYTGMSHYGTFGHMYIS